MAHIDSSAQEVVERDGFRFLVELFYDPDHEAPWDDGDGNGIVIEPDRYYTKKPGHRLLWSSDRHYKWFFDWQGTVQKAKDENWGLNPEAVKLLAQKLGRAPTKGDLAAAATQSEYNRIRAWLRGEWWYCGVVVTKLTDDPEEDDSVETDFKHAVWGLEDGYYTPEYGPNYGQYKAEVVEELVSGYIEELAKERAERQYWAERDVVTLP